MSVLPPYEQTTGALRKLYEVERMAELMGAIMGLDPDAHLRCRGNPSECGEGCSDDSCPLRNNLLQDLGSMVTTLLEEFRWHRAWGEELEDLLIVPAGTSDRVTLRVQRERLQDTLKEAIEANEAIQGVQVLRDRVVNRIGQLRAEIEALDQKLGATGGHKA